MDDFGKFSLLQYIGGGRLSEVFRVGRAWDKPQSDQPLRGRGIALKRVHPSLIGEQAFVQLVAREAGLLTHLEHQALCESYEMGVIDGSAFLTMELIDGCTLRALMRRLAKLEVSLPRSATLSIATQLADVLDYLHRRCATPLIHLDLSPQNVMISRDGQLKLIDFGIARFRDGHNPPPLGGKIAGTVGYMSPEQARGDENLGPRADQFALGILLWELAHQQRLFRGNTKQTWDRMRTGDLGEVSLDESDEFERILGSLLEPDPDARFDSMRSVRDALEGTATSSSTRKPLAALVTRLLEDESFDPFDTAKPRRPLLDKEDEPTLDAIPTGETDISDDYEELEISVNHGAGTPSAQMRAVLTSEIQLTELPSSPFLEEDSVADVLPAE